MSIATCANCRGPLPLEYAANFNALDGTRTCLGTCRPLYLFKNDNPDWVVAEDEVDAFRAWCEHMGENPADYDGDEQDWRQLSDDETATYWIAPDGTLSCPDDGDGAELTRLTALEVVQRFGRGFFASVDF